MRALRQPPILPPLTMDDDDEYDLGEIMETQLHNDEDLDDPNPSRHNTAALTQHSSQHSSLLALPASHFTPRPPLPIIGLHNSGATCYLNSLLQALYMTPEWRAGAVPAGRGGDRLAGLERRGGQQERQRTEGRRWRRGRRNTRRQEVEVSEADVSELVSMGFDEDKARLALKMYPSIDQREQAIDYIFTLPTPLPTPPATSAHNRRSLLHPLPPLRLPVPFVVYRVPFVCSSHSCSCTTMRRCPHASSRRRSVGVTPTLACNTTSTSCTLASWRPWKAR